MTNSELTRVQDLAHELLGLVIEGPEEDLIWSAFNENEEQGAVAMEVDNDEGMDGYLETIYPSPM
jgi:hypothetical protein